MKTTKSPELLKDYFIQNFNFLSKKEADLMAAYSKRITFEPGDILLEYEKYERQLFYIINGLVRGFRYIEELEEYNLFFSDSGKCILSPEKFLSKEKKLNSVTFVAVSKVEALSFDHNELIQLAQENPGIFEFYHDCLKQISNSMFERIQLLLIDNAEDRYRHLAKTRPIVVKQAHKKHLAQYLGITPNSYSRLIRKITKVNKKK